MKIISNNKGLSLVEALVGIIVISVAGVGLLKVSQQTILTSQITETHRSTSKLKNQLYSVLNDEDVCKHNLKPNALETNGKLTDNTFETLTVGPIEGGLIEIKRMALKNPPQDNSDNTPTPQDDPDNTPPQNSKIFYLYYKYNSPALGDNQQRTDDPCTEENVSGCYYLSCEIKYNCTNDDCNNPDDKCMPLNCGFSEDVNLSNFDCPPGKFLVGGTRNNSLCVGCDEGEHLIGTKISNGNPPEAICLKKIDCEAGKVPVGIKLEEGKYVMDCMDLICPSGEYMVLRPGEEEEDPPVSKCEKICHGGKVIQTIDGKKQCACKEGFTADHNGNCVCPSASSVINSEGDCVCSENKGIKNSEGDCECLGGIAGNICYCRAERKPEDDNCICFEGQNKGKCLSGHIGEGRLPTIFEIEDTTE